MTTQTVSIREQWITIGAHHKTAEKLEGLKLTPGAMLTGLSDKKFLESNAFDDKFVKRIKEVLSEAVAEGTLKDDGTIVEAAPEPETAVPEVKETRAKVVSEDAPKKTKKEKDKEDEDAMPTTLAQRNKIIDKLIKDGLIKRGSDEELDYGKMSTGHAAINKMSGGGWPKGKFSLISGPSSTCKTELALDTVATCHKEDSEAIVVWANAENSFDAAWAASHEGLDLGRILIVPPMLAEDMFDKIEELIQAVAPALVIVDSIGALLPWQEVQKKADDKEFTKGMASETMAMTARFMGKMHRRFTPMVAKYKPAFVSITHIYSVIGGYTGQEDAKGGNAMKFGAHLWIWTERRKGDQDAKTKIAMPDGRVLELFTAYEVVFKVQKTRQSGTEGHKVAIPFVFGKGLAERDSVIEMAMAMGIIQNSGSYYGHASFTKHVKDGWVNGREKSIAFIKENDDVFDAILDEMGKKIALEHAAPPVEEENAS